MKLNPWKQMNYGLLLLSYLMLIACGGDSVSESSTSNSSNVSNQKSTISGTLLDEEGQPIVGALVVAGENSPTDITDENGAFEIEGVPEGDQALNVITEGHYTLAQDDLKVSGDINVGEIRSKVIDEHFKSPKFISVSVIVEDGQVKFSAKIQKGEEGSEVNDVRAELPGYNTGTALELSSDGLYTGEIALPENAGGPKLSVVFFGIDEDKRVGTSYATSNEFDGNGGDYVLSSIDGTWIGSLKFHKRDRKERGEQRGNSKLSISNGVVNAVYTTPSFRLLKGEDGAPFNDVVYDDGTATLVDQFLGTYLIHLEDDDNMIELLANKTAGGLIGFMKITDSKAQESRRNSRGRFHLRLNDDHPVSIEDASGKWASSMSLITSNSTSSIGVWKPRYQMNALTVVGTNATGITTLGHELVDLSVELLDSDLRKFKITYTYDDGSVVTAWALLGHRGNRMFGVHRSVNGDDETCGLYWSRLGDEGDLFSLADLEGWYQGEMIMEAGEASRRTRKRITFQLDENGLVKEGLLNIGDSTIGAGSFSFKDISSGEVTGNISGTKFKSDDQNLSISFTTVNIRSSSMGVMKSRIVGEFEGELNGEEIKGTMFVHKIHRATRSIRDRIREHARE